MNSTLFKPATEGHVAEFGLPKLARVAHPPTEACELQDG